MKGHRRDRAQQIDQMGASMDTADRFADAPVPAGSDLQPFQLRERTAGRRGGGKPSAGIERNGSNRAVFLLAEFMRLDANGQPVDGRVIVDGVEVSTPVELPVGEHRIAREPGPEPLYLLPAGLPDTIRPRGTLPGIVPLFQWPYTF